MSDGALAVSKAFVDSQTGVTITAVSQGAGGLTVSVASPQTHGDPGIYRKLNASNAPVYKFFLDYGSGQTVDAKIPFGMAGDIPLTGNFTSDGLTSIGIYRNGTWYFDTSRDGSVDKIFNLGGVPGDVPLAANFTGAGATDDLVIYRAGTWYVDQFHNGTVDKIFHLGGVAGDIPLAGDRTRAEHLFSGGDGCRRIHDEMPPKASGRQILCPDLPHGRARPFDSSGRRDRTPNKGASKHRRKQRGSEGAGHSEYPHPCRFPRSLARCPGSKNRLLAQRACSRTRQSAAEGPPGTDI
jgi:hypothetical protein